MNLDNLNKWLVFGANIGVLIGILFLAAEVRQNSNIARTDSYREIVRDVAQWRTNLNTNPELRSLWGEYFRGEYTQMESQEQLRVRWLVNNLLGTLESAYLSHEYGILSDLEWGRFEADACDQYRATVRNELLRLFITEEFREYLSITCEDESLTLF